MTKQEYMAMSLPYGLKCQTKLSGGVKSIIGSSFGNNILFRIAPEYGRDYLLPCLRIFPILRPLSDLTKEIEHKGDKFVPIVKLMQIAYESQDRCITSKSVYVEDNMHTVKVNVFEFAFDIDDNSFISILNNSLSAVPNQLDLFQQLVKWHFDLFGGIESGEAIDVNTLDINPYK